MPNLGRVSLIRVFNSPLYHILSFPYYRAIQRVVHLAQNVFKNQTNYCCLLTVRYIIMEPRIADKKNATLTTAFEPPSSCNLQHQYIIRRHTFIMLFVHRLLRCLIHQNAPSVAAHHLVYVCVCACLYDRWTISIKQFFRRLVN